MYLSPNAPHHPAYYAPRHASMFSDEPLPRLPSFDEADVSDKPRWVQNKPLLSSTKVQKLGNLYRNRLRALQAVDEMTGRLVSALQDTGELDNTYIVFTSDNGIYLGEHRLTQKAAAYEEAIRVPLLVRGPGVPEGATRDELVLNNDLAPTIASWAGVTPPSFVDGRTLLALLSERPSASWRSAFLIEHRRSAEEHANVRAIPDYYAVRTTQHIYVEYPGTGEKELYDLDPANPRYDPFQLTNTYKSAPTALISNLEARQDALRRCAGADASATSCKTAEDGR
jgi:N-acetylglucosamine-6-sulfatase